MTQTNFKSAFLLFLVFLASLPANLSAPVTHIYGLMGL